MKTILTSCGFSTVEAKLGAAETSSLRSLTTCSIPIPSFSSLEKNSIKSTLNETK